MKEPTANSHQLLLMGHFFCASILSLKPLTMKQSRAVVHFALGAIFSFLILSQFSFKTNSVSNTRQQWFVPSLPEDISFAGEKVPVSRWDVKEKFDKEMLVNYYD